MVMLIIGVFALMGAASGTAPHAVAPKNASAGIVHVGKGSVKPVTPNSGDGAMKASIHAKVDLEVTPDPSPVVVVTNEEVAGAAFKTVHEAQKYIEGRKDKSKSALLLAAVIAALLKFLIALIRRTSPFWKKTRGKWVIRMLTLTLGLVAGVVANYALGMSWMDAVVVFMGGPGAVIITEYQKLIPFLRGKPDDSKSDKD